MISWFKRRLKVSEMQRATGTKARSSEHITMTNPWHAVGISPGAPACQACQFMKSARFLSSDAPLLPLQGCTQPKTCSCRYRHFSDRRTGPRRSAERELYQSALARHAETVLERERRVSKGRRASDGR
jgi:hypothetical protein